MKALYVLPLSAKIAVMMPTFAVLASAAFDHPMAILATVASERFVGALSWPAPMEKGTGSLEMAAISEPISKRLRRSPSRRKIVVRAEVDCLLCEKPMLNGGTRLEWISPFELRVKTFAALCATCTGRVIADPDYLVNRLREIAHPKLHSFEGGRSGDGKPLARGTLRLVKHERDGAPGPNKPSLTLLDPRATLAKASLAHARHLPGWSVRRKERRPIMSTRMIRVRVRGGRLEPLDDLPLAEGSETMVAVEVPDEARPVRRKTTFRSWNLGLGAREITREDAYDDAL